MFVAALLLVVLFLWTGLFAANIYFVEKLPGSTLAQGVATRESPVVLPEPVVDQELPPRPYPPIAPTDGEDLFGRMPSQVFAFLPEVPDSTYASLDAGSDAIDVVMPEWFSVETVADGVVAVDREDENQVYVSERIAREAPRMGVIPVIRISQEVFPTGDFDADTLSALANEIGALAEQEQAPGLCVLPTGVGVGEVKAIGFFLSELDAVLAADGRSSCLMTGEINSLLVVPEIVDAVDQVALKAFVDPWIGVPPGPLAAQDWYEGNLRSALDRVGRDKLVVMLGSFAVDWSRGAVLPEKIPFAEALRRVARNRGTVDFPAGPANLRMRYTGADGVAHEIWALDAASLYNQIRTLAGLGIERAGLWALGYEDPSIWPLLSTYAIDPDIAARLISRVDLSGFVGYDGDGPFQRLIAAANTGQRFVHLDSETGMITGEFFDPMPEPWSVARFGEVAPDAIAITFDDGPDPDYTSQILDVLKDRDATATFFVVGAHVLKEPDLVRRMVDEGHEVGSHTFLHPPLHEVPSLRSLFEINAMQRLLAVVTGRVTVLFRNPYGRGEGPVTGEGAAPLGILEETGHVVVGSEVVPPDWRNFDADGIVEFVMDRLATRGGNVIVLHDGGGDRQATVDALGPLIDRLRGDGYRVVPLAEMLGVSRDVVMPPAEGSRTFLDRISFGLLSLSGAWLVVLFWVVVLGGVLRSVVMLLLAHLRRRHPVPAEGYAPPVTVVIPAYNEEETILKCISSVFSSDYSDLRVIVVDDGSTDHTFERVAAVASGEPRLRLIHEKNQGKWMALDTAYNELETDIVVAIDADSLIAPGAIGNLVRHFADPKVGAVAGRVQVGNRHGLLTRLQALEYLTAQNIDRRAFERLNAMLVVPGAIGAWRASAVRDAGLYSAVTVTEDADLTISVIRAGYRVVYDEDAYAVTEAPETVQAFLRQRLRWTFGMLQTAFKHVFGAMRQGKAVGWVSLPDLLLVGFGLSMLAPLADLILMGALADLALDLALDRPERVVDMRLPMVAGYLVLPLLDVVTMLLALRFDRSESPALVLLFPVQRFFYRQLLYFTAWRAGIRALIGKLTSWGKLARLGTAQLPARGGT